MMTELKGLIDFTYERPDGSKRTLKLAAPIVEEGRELTHPLEDYFPSGSPWLWFEKMSERDHRDYIVGQIMGGGCPIFGYPHPDGESIETHHEYRKGMGGRIEAETPWTMIASLKSLKSDRSAHDLYHAYTLTNMGFRLVHWDFLDLENGLVVHDEHDEPIARENLWFYGRPTNERVDVAWEWLAEMKATVKVMTDAQYLLGSLIDGGSEKAKLLGYHSAESMLAQHGIGNDTPKLMRLLHEGCPGTYEDMSDRTIIPEAADLYRKRLTGKDDEEKEEWLKKLYEFCSPNSAHPSFRDFGQLIRGRFPSEPRKTNIIELQLASGVSEETTEELGDAIVVAEILERAVYNPSEEAASGKIIFVGHKLPGGDPEKRTEPEDDSE